MTLLATKLDLPRGRHPRVSRPRLLNALEHSTSRLTLLSAPAGYGKSSLLTDWLSSTERPVAWVDLDESDNDPARFFSYLIAALRRAHQGVAADLSLPLERLDAADLPALLTRLLNDLAGVGEKADETTGETLLVLDDYHLIESDTVHEAMQFWLEHAPPGLRTVLSGRSDPPLLLSRWRVRGELTELRADDLRFRPDETTLFLKEVMALTLTHEDERELEQRTEGWIAGLQLAALSLRGKREVSGFIERFTGTDRYILDYLTEEVLGKEDADTQNFLLLTSMLKRLCGPLCDAVTEQTGSQARLEALERDNLFIVPLDNQRLWYRYHTFFAELLYHRLTQARPDLLPRLHERASHWFEHDQQSAEALRHALLAQDASRVAALLRAHPQAEALEAKLRQFMRAPAEETLEAMLPAAMTLATSASAEARSRLFAAFESVTPDLHPSLYPQPTPEEALSERELEVLRLMAAGYANKDIAKRLDISLNTVKTHTKNIHSKLMVASRTQASVRARELGLL